MKKERSVFILGSAILATIYLLYLFIDYGKMVSSSEGIVHETAVTLLMMIAPHMIFLAIGVVFTWFSYVTNLRALAFTGGIIYVIGCVAGILFLPTNLFIIPSIILNFIGFAKMKKTQQKEVNNKNVDHDSIS